MQQERANLGFADALDDFNPDEFAPKPTAKPKPNKEETAKAAQAAGFKSREVIKPASNDAQQKGGQRRHRTGRNAQFNMKAKPETIAAYTAVADAQGWTLAETLEHAVALLEREYSEPDS